MAAVPEVVADEPEPALVALGVGDVAKVVEFPLEPPVTTAVEDGVAMVLPVLDPEVEEAVELAVLEPEEDAEELAVELALEELEESLVPFPSHFPEDLMDW